MGEQHGSPWRSLDDWAEGSVDGGGGALRRAPTWPFSLSVWSMSQASAWTKIVMGLWLAGLRWALGLGVGRRGSHGSWRPLDDQTVGSVVVGSPGGSTAALAVGHMCLIALCTLAWAISCRGACDWVASSVRPTPGAAWAVGIVTVVG